MEVRPTPAATAAAVVRRIDSCLGTPRLRVVFVPRSRDAMATSAVIMLVLRVAMVLGAAHDALAHPGRGSQADEAPHIDARVEEQEEVRERWLNMRVCKK